jgi:8-oxo-dGTP pyrophosphatase MutT (NUDIX family)
MRPPQVRAILDRRPLPKGLHAMTFERLRQAGEPAIRRLLHVYWRFSRGMTLGVRAVVIDAAGRIFLVKHSYVSGWHLPGGGVEVGETAVEALTRELAEEGNITPTTPVVLHGFFFNASASRRDHVAVFVVRGYRQDAPPQPNGEIIDHGFFPPDALPPDATAGTRRRVAEVIDGAALSPLW